MKKFTLTVSTMMLTAAAFAQPAETEAPVTSLAKPEAPALAGDNQTWKDLGEGTFSDFVLSNLFVGFFNQPVTVMVQESEQNPGVYRLVNPWTCTNENIPFDEDDNFLIIDARDPEFVKVPKQRSPVDDSVDGETWYCSYSYYFEDIYGWDLALENYGLDKETYKERQADKTPVLKDGVIKFPLNSMAVMYPYGTGEEFKAGTWSYANMEYDGYLVLPGSAFEGDWKSLGKGKFLEGFLETLLADDPKTYVPEEREIEIMENREVPGVYKLVRAFEFSAPTGQDMIIDARKPDFVRVEKQNTGVNTTKGWAYIMSASTTDSFTSYENMVDLHPEFAARNITLDETGFHFPKNSIYLHFPTVDNVTVYDNGYAVDSYFLFPGLTGVKNVADENSDAPAEYYNLQGMRVAQPASGELTIVRQGSKTYKTIIR